jgi:SAM-dependent methyltransferase
MKRISGMRELIRKLIPASLRAARRDWLIRRQNRPFENLPPKEVFRRVYKDGLWGKDQNYPFFSGSGSRGEAVSRYIEALERFLGSFPEKLDVVDLGCGDFTVGSRIRPLCRRYVACDVVEEMIEEHRKRFADLNVEFRSIDMTADPLPGGDVVCIRQVLQHLSNAQIAATIRKIPATYRYLVLTEHVPAEPFAPNIDKPVGPHTRLNNGGPKSGVVLTEAPFNLRGETSVLCESSDYLGIIRTTLFRF